EAERRDIEKVLVLELGSGMPLNGELKIGRAHAFAVVGDPDQRQATAGRHHVDGAGAGVEGVFQELLDHTGRTFDYLAGSDAIDRLEAELANGHDGSRVGR